MFIEDKVFTVTFTEHSQRYFCKSFLKKYKQKPWMETIKTIEDTLERSFLAQQKDLIDNIRFSQAESVGIFKLDFRVAGTNTSPKSSGNRAIFALSNRDSQIDILLVYGKNHLKGSNETQWVLGQIKSHYPKYKKLCT